jgi:hypothetical protein
MAECERADCGLMPDRQPKARTVYTGTGDRASGRVLRGQLHFDSCISVARGLVDAGAVGGGGRGGVSVGWVGRVLFVLPARSRGVYPRFVEFLLSLATVVPLFDLLPSPPLPPVSLCCRYIYLHPYPQRPYVPTPPPYILPFPALRSYLPTTTLQHWRWLLQPTARSAPIPQAPFARSPAQTKNKQWA